MVTQQEVAARPWRMLIGGELTEALEGRQMEVWNPSRGEVLTKVPWAGAEDVGRAVEAAKGALQEWWLMGPQQRAARLRRLGQLIRENAEELTWLDAANSGNPLRACWNDVIGAAARCDDIASLLLEVRGQTIPATNPRDLHYSVREPFGVAGVIMPFNHPALFTMQMLGPLGVGNAVIFKSSDQAPLSALRIGELCAEVFPPGVVNIVTGDGATTGAAIARHPDVRLVNFIGSAPTARRIMQLGAEETVKSYVMELGGKNPLIVCPDADLSRAVQAVVDGMNLTSCQGQSCVSTSRVLLHSSLKDEFLEQYKTKLEEIPLGDPMEQETQMGSLITHAHQQRVMSYIEKGKKQGARLVSGGGPPQDPELAKGAYVAPTLFDRVTPDMAIAQEEIFGPVVSVLEWETEEQVLEVANGVRYGLTAAVWTQDLERAHRMAGRLQAGRVFINSPVRFFSRTPFGFYKESGVGTEGGVTGLESFTQLKTVHLIASG